MISMDSLSDLKTLNLSNNYELQDDIDCYSWLSEIDLLQYLETFLTNLSNDGRVIRRKRLNQLRQQDLSSMNITNYIHQKLLMEHIRLVQKYPFHSPLRKKELKPIVSSSPSKILTFENNKNDHKQVEKKKNKVKTSSVHVHTQEKTITTNTLAIDKKKHDRRRRSFDAGAWNSIINMRNRADQNANKAELLRDGVFSRPDVGESKSISQETKVVESKHNPTEGNNRRRTKSDRRHSFNGIDPEEALRKDFLSGERTKAKMYGNMALEYDIMLSQLHTLQGEILQKFKATINCEVASIFFVNTSTQELLLYSHDFKWYKIPMGVGICGYCLQTGENLNIPDAYADYRFNSNMDKKTNFKTRNILCQPIRSHRGGGPIIGIIQMLNKIGADSFDNSDEELLSTFMIQIADLLHMRFSELIDLADKFSGQAIFVGGKGGEMLNKINYTSDTAASKANALPIKEYK